jgi:energy-converting hydrogenase A subunit R
MTLPARSTQKCRASDEENQINNYICFDLEGPLSPQDNAYDLMKLVPQGGTLFELISRYDDLLTMEGREDYEPGDTLALIVPFLLLHGITENDIIALARKASLTQGASELVSALRESGWEVYCITTTYEQYAHHITGVLGIPRQHVAATPFPLDSFSKKLTKDEVDLLRKGEEDILELSQSTDDRHIKNKLDDFFWSKLPKTPLGKLIRSVKPVGGQRKVSALTRFATESQQPFSNWVVVADSITDFKMLKTVDQAGGLAIAFNANQYALPYATLGLASTHLSDLEPILSTWWQCGRPGVQKQSGQILGDVEGNRNNFDWLAAKGVDIYDVISLHRRLRKVVREKAGELG